MHGNMMIQMKAFKNGFNTCVISHTGGFTSACSTKACIGREQNRRYCKPSCNTLLCDESFKSDSFSLFSISVLYLTVFQK